MASMMTMGLVAGGVVAAAVAGIAALIVKELSKPPPKGGSKFTLPNGMEIQHWQKGETEFLYTEIFGKESAYSQDDKILFVPGATVVDAGANIGMFSLFAAKQCKGDATILAFEPIPSTHAVLAANANNLNTGAYQAQFGAGKDAKVSMTAYNKGLSNKPAQVVFE
ncbi:FkbM family methyltransferase, partial [archaeon]